MSVVDPTPYPTITALPVPVVDMTPVAQVDPWAPVAILVVAIALGVVVLGRNVGSLLAAGALLIAFDAIRLNVTGVAVLGAVLWLIAFWMLGGFTREFWIAPQAPAGDADALGYASTSGGRHVPGGLRREDGAR